MIHRVIPKMLEDDDSDVYANAFYSVAANFRAIMHRYAREYYCSLDIREIDFEDPIIKRCLLRRDETFRISKQVKICFQAYSDRNYVFLVTEFVLQQRGKISQNDLRILQPIIVATRLHFRRYDQCESRTQDDDLIEDWNDLFEIALIAKEYDFAETAWRLWQETHIVREVTNQICETYRVILILFVKNALKSGKWTELRNFVHDISKPEFAEVFRIDIHDGVQTPDSVSAEEFETIKQNMVMEFTD